MSGLREALVGATRIVVETDHVYEQVGRIVALDVQRVEFTLPDFRAALTAELVTALRATAGLYELRGKRAAAIVARLLDGAA